MEIDLEVPADRQQLQSLIRKQADDANKKLAAQVKKLERQIGNLTIAKNPKRGRKTTGGASTTKTKSQSPSTKKKKELALEADASNNGSNDDSSGKNTTTGKKKSKRKKNRTGTRNNTRS